MLCVLGNRSVSMLRLLNPVIALGLLKRKWFSLERLRGRVSVYNLQSYDSILLLY